MDERADARVEFWNKLQLAPIKGDSNPLPSGFIHRIAEKGCSRYVSGLDNQASEKSSSRKLAFRIAPTPHIRLTTSPYIQQTVLLRQCLRCPLYCLPKIVFAKI